MVFKTAAWDLKEIYPNDLNLKIKQIDKKAKSLEKKRKLLTNNISSKQFITFVKELETLRIEIAKLSCATSLRFSENSANQKAVAEMSKVETSLTNISNRLLFFNLWFKQLPDKKSKQLIKECGDYSYYFQYLRKVKHYTLKENEEKIINIKNVTGPSALNNVYNILTSQFKYTFKGKEVTQNELIVAVRNPSPKVRKEAYLTLLGKYKHYKDVIGEIYKNLVNDWREECLRLRGYKSPISVRNVSNDLPDKAVEVLLKVCEKNQHIFHKFFELKRKNLGLKKLTRFDLYAPLKHEKERNMSYDQAVKLVLNTFNDFSPQFSNAAKEIIDRKHVHSKLQKNKHTGAYCCSVSAKLPPYVLLNYTGTLRDVSTLAHELGHGIHHMLSKDHREFTFHSCLPLAETASIFGEMLLSEKLMKDYPKEAKSLIFTKLGEIYASIIRQASFVQFEVKAHQMLSEGKTLEEVSQVYLADLKKQLGKKIEVDKIFAYEWCYIPHIFHTPFYCYAYAFGNLLVLALWEMYKEEGKIFVPKMIKFLANGGSKSPLEITTEIGVDICSEEFWQKGFKAIEEMIERVA